MKIISLLLLSLLPTYFVVSKKNNNVKPSDTYFDLDKATENSKLVKILDLTNKGYSFLPQDISMFINLEQLRLAENDFITLPDQFASLSNLDVIDLGGNQKIDLRKTIPTLAKSKNLKKLYLNDCALSFVPYKIELLNSLETLDLSDNYITELPFYISKLKKLKYVDLSNNNLKELGYAPSLWQNLECINLKGNDSLDLENTFLSLSFIKTLEQVELSNISELPKNIDQLKCKEIVFSNSKLQKVPAELSENKIIEKVSFQSSNGTDFDKVMEHLAPLKQLKEVKMVDCFDAIPSRLKTLSQLEKLDLSNNNLKSIKLKLADIPGLKELKIYGNQLSNKELEALQIEFPNCTIISGIQKIATDNKKIQPPHEKLRVVSNEYQVEPTQENVIECGETKINIPANAFLDKNGNVVTSPVKIQYREFHDPIDVILSGIPMAYDSAGKSYNLETAGMLEFRATSNGQEVFPNQKAVIDVELMSKRVEDGYNIYQFDDATGDWTFKDVSVMLDSNKSPITAREIKSEMDRASFENIEYIPAKMTLDLFPENQFFNLKKIKHTREYKIEMNIHGMTGTGEFRKKFFTNKIFKNFELIYAGTNKREISKALKDFNRKGGAILDQDFSYFQTTRLELDKENDCFNFIAEYTDTTISIPVYVRPRHRNMEKEQKINVRFWKTYQKLKLKEEREHEKQEARFKAGLDKYEVNNSVVQNTNRLNLVKTKRRFKPLAALVRPLQLLSFGIWNADCLPPVIEIEQEVRQIELVAATTGEAVYPEKITVINKARNSFESYSTNSLPFKDNMNSSLMMFLSNGDVAYIRNTDLKPILKQGGIKIKIPLTIVNTDEVSVAELRKLILG